MAGLTLSEYRAKELLSKYGITIPAGIFVKDEKSAINGVKKLGYPVVVKGVSQKIIHKTEAGIVKVGINNDKDLIKAMNEIKEKGGNDIEGMLIENQISGKREFIAGIIKDPQFGFCIMFGLGGIFTEAIDDVVFRIAPIEYVDAEEMIDEIRAKKLLSPFRGEAAVNRDELCKFLCKLSRLPEYEKGLKEVDINPLIPSDDKIYAVDAVFVYEEC